MAAHAFAPALRRRAGRALAQQPGEHAAQDAVDHAAHQRPPQHVVRQRLAREGTEVRVVAGDGHHQETGGQHADQHQALPAQHRAAAQLLDGEDHAGQRRIEGCRQPAGRARGYQLLAVKAAQRHAEAAPELAPRQHQRGAHLHRGALAADRCASQHGQEGKRNLPQGLDQRDQALLRPARRQGQAGDHLRNAAARCIGRQAQRQPAQDGQRARRHDQGQPAVGGGPLPVPVQRQVGQLRKAQRHQRNQRRAAQQQGHAQRPMRDAPHLAQLAAPQPAQMNEIAVRTNGQFRIRHGRAGQGRRVAGRTLPSRTRRGCNANGPAGPGRLDRTCGD
ncbi:Uncharacterised protein [Bordetella pertussis]|nr:Uncharacterised protein [Bordetella pertussis]